MVSGTPTGTPTWNGLGVPGNTIIATITVATGGIRDIQKAYEEFPRGIEEQQRTASLLFFQQANEDPACLLGVQECQLVEMAEGLLRAAEIHESRRQDEFQKALTYLRDCYTRELDVARTQNSKLLVARRLHEEVLSRVQKDVERVLEVGRREDHLRHDGPMSSLREELWTLKRNHQDEIYLVREAAPQDEAQSKASELESVQEALQAALRDLSFRESANAVFGN
ncbi:hypothetical protein DYB37_008333 [Aphanomyces astaci]|uniref:Uncharacterized protein n=1 Tax=Aphanomyces astaci TaxID=112090 RepID=A0A3R6X7R2_APHAT|nr:hypothetical protein DYB37_008333 [Aphanomyces astaci]